ncbi:MAG: N-acyl homoserine lactonase family protein [Acidobacteriota bacterium]
MAITTGEYEVYALKYGTHARKRSENFIMGDPHDGPMPIDFYVWAIVGQDHTGKPRTIVVDTGFDHAMATKRNREIYRTPTQGLQLIGINPETIKDVVITHMHYDHAGSLDEFPNARYHLQDREMEFCTGRYMCNATTRFPFEASHVTTMINRIFEGRVEFHDGDSELAPGITLHHVGGHSLGLQVVRVKTKRGYVVLASDAAHFYENMESMRPYPVVVNVAEMVEGFKTIQKLATSVNHVIPGHDPLVLSKYPAAAPGLEGIVARLDVDPR